MFTRFDGKKFGAIATCALRGLPPSGGNPICEAIMYIIRREMDLFML